MRIVIIIKPMYKAKPKNYDEGRYCTTINLIVPPPRGRVDVSRVGFV